MKRVLFICGKCRQRSPTAAQLFAGREGWEVDCAGLGHDADVLVSNEQIEWATDIAVMEKRQIARLRRLFPRQAQGKRLVSLDIPDHYAFMQAELIQLLEKRIGRVG